MPDRDMARHGGQRLFVEHLGDQAEILEHQHLGAVGHGDTGRLLTAVLESVKAVIGEFRNVLAGGPDAEDAAFFPGRALDLVGHDVGCSPVGDGAQSTGRTT